MKAALIYKDTKKLNIRQRIFLKKYFESLKKEMSCAGISFFAYGLPMGEKINRQIIEKGITYLKEEKITHLLLAEDIEQEEVIFKRLSENFQIILGNSIINHSFFDILRKCAGKRNIEIDKSTVVLVTDRPKLAEAFIMKLYRHVKRIRIETEKKDIFLPLTDYFINEYGLYITVGKEERKQDELIVVADEDKKDVFFDFDVSLSAFYRNRIYFKLNKRETGIHPYIKLHQAALEFLMIEKYGSFLESTARRFVKEFNVRIVKIENID